MILHTIQFYVTYLKLYLIGVISGFFNQQQLNVISNWRISPYRYDVITGYTADDQYSDIFKSFIKNDLSFIGFCKAILLGNLGYQYVIRTHKAYDQLYINKEGENHRILSSIWYQKAIQRKIKANSYFNELLKEHSRHSEELFFKDIVGDNLQPDDQQIRYPFDLILEDKKIDLSVLNNYDIFKTLNM